MGSRISGSGPPDCGRSCDAPSKSIRATGRSALDQLPIPTQVEILARKLPDAEVERIWADANQHDESPEKRYSRVRDALQNSLARPHAGPNPPTVETPPVPYVGRRPPEADTDSLVLQILHLGLQLPEGEVKQVWAEARRKTTDETKQREYVRDQLEKLVAKRKADGTLPKAKPEAPASK